MLYKIYLKKDGNEAPDMETREREKALRRVSELILAGYDHRTVRVEQIPTEEDVSQDMGGYFY